MIKVKKKVNSDKYFGTNGVCIYIYCTNMHAAWTPAHVFYVMYVMCA
jgi:hypothetical protein